LNLVVSSPSVVFKIINPKGKEFPVFSASDWPMPNEIKEAKEPWAWLEVITPVRYLGDVLAIMEQLKGNSIETKYFGEAKTILTYEVPLKGLIAGFYDKLKEASQGFASMSYEILEDRPADLTKIEILIAGKKEEAFSRVVYSADAFKEGERMTRKLKELLPSQLFSVAIQAAIGGKIIARSTISAKRRDVIAPLYGGDYTRKRKLLEQQKKGKKELKEKGQVRIPSQVFLEMFKS
jgi:GTP-binding protein LepA